MRVFIRLILIVSCITLLLAGTYSCFFVIGKRDYIKFDSEFLTADAEQNSFESFIDIVESCTKPFFFLTGIVFVLLIVVVTTCLVQGESYGREALWAIVLMTMEGFSVLGKNYMIWSSLL